jgi:hypothetical protein
LRLVGSTKTEEPGLEETPKLGLLLSHDSSIIFYCRVFRSTFGLEGGFWPAEFSAEKFSPPPDSEARAFRYGG